VIRSAAAALLALGLATSCGGADGAGFTLGGCMKVLAGVKTRCA
jgi:hypothetical protein